LGNILDNISEPYIKYLSGIDPVSGRYEGVELVWGDVFETSFAYYPAKDLHVFNQTLRRACPESMTTDQAFPRLLPPKKTTLGVLAWAGAFANASFAEEPISDLSDSTLRSREWEGDTYWTTARARHGQVAQAVWNSSGASQSMGGQGAGPLALYGVESYHAPALVASPLSDFFTSAVILDAQSGRLVFGPSYEYYYKMHRSNRGNQFYPKFERSIQFALSGAEGGITAAFDAWGRGMRSWFQTDHAPHLDAMTERVGFWTDNGADLGLYNFYPDMMKKGVPEDILLRVSKELKKELGFPMAYYQLDAWWYPLHAEDVFCIREFEANRTMFPHGLKWLSEQVESPMALYGHMFCNDTSLRSRFDMKEPQNRWWWNGYNTCPPRVKCPIKVAQPVSDAAEAFYRDIMGIAKSDLNMLHFEVDFMDIQFGEYVEYVTEPGEHRKWLKGMADAALALNVSVQYCMPLPGHMLQTLEFPAVTNARASPDGGRPFTNMGPTNMLLWALDVRPFKDNSLSRQGDDFVGSVVARSPVGIGDAKNFDFRAIKRTCRSDGVILHPSRPGFPLNAHYHPRAGRGAGTWLTHSEIPGLTCYTALTGEWAVDEEWLITPADLYPKHVDPQALMWWAWNDPAERVRDRMPNEYGARPSQRCNGTSPRASARECLTRMSSKGFPVVGGGADRFRLYHACPEMFGWTLLGETSKYMPVSPNRLARVAPLTESESGGLIADVIGSPGEQVELTYARPDGTLSVLAKTLPINGLDTFVLT
jgi:hypothetical protein